MNWENRFSTMVKESSAKIDQAKMRLQNFDTSRIDSLKNTGPYSGCSPVAFQNNAGPETSYGVVEVPNNVSRVDYQSDPLLSSGSASVSLLYTLWEKVERQNKVSDFLKTKVETLQTELIEQQKEMENFKERLSQLCFKVDRYEPVQDDLTVEEWKTEIRSELNNIKARLFQRGNDDDDPAVECKSKTERERSSVVERDALLVNCMNEIKNRLDKIEGELSRSCHNAENSSKIVEKDDMLLTDWKKSSEKSLTRLCKMQDLSVAEVKHLRSKLYSIQDKVHDLETAMNDDVRLNNDLAAFRKQSDSTVEDRTNVMLENHKCTRLHLSSDCSEEDQSSLTGSSLNLDVSDNGDLSENDEFVLDESIKDEVERVPDSSLDSLSGSDSCLTDI